MGLKSVVNKTQSVMYQHLVSVIIFQSVLRDNLHYAKQLIGLFVGVLSKILLVLGCLSLLCNKTQIWAF